MDHQQSLTNLADVSLTLTGRLSSTEANKNKNLVISPLSLHVILGVIAAGSSGSTRDQLLTYLKANSSDELNKLCAELVSLVFADGSATGGPKLSYANGVWVDQTLPLNPTFKHLLDHVYKASSNQVDFCNKDNEVALDVNSWAKDKTNGLISDSLAPNSIDCNTKLIFANAIYFKGAWKEKFDASRTKEDDFYLLNGNSIKVPFMTTKYDQFIKAFIGFKVLRLPYEQGEEDKRQFSMYLFLPDEKDGLPALMQKLNSEPAFLHKLLPLLAQKVQAVEFKIPKFKFSFGFEASNVLKWLGVELPFKEGGLTEMTDSSSAMAQKLYVSDIFQKSFIEIDEEGTESAAASRALFKCCRMPMLNFVANYPFMFLIRDDITGAVLFTGQVMNPLED
ncbi:serpin-ZX-like [Chenopodium quinoa]|uniref:Serpin domain-containing protein n=1 Tax=Chenopodium quinoa TaxID=63459 RepID=A0A803MGL1_CHEQI|nr:serpin-ZX-like [Chenopodium quinoa]